MILEIGDEIEIWRNIKDGHISWRNKEDESYYRVKFPVIDIVDKGNTVVINLESQPETVKTVGEKTYRIFGFKRSIESGGIKIIKAIKIPCHWCSL